LVTFLRRNYLTGYIGPGIWGETPLIFLRRGLGNTTTRGFGRPGFYPGPGIFKGTSPWASRRPKEAAGF